MRYDLPERVIRELFSFATKHSVRKIILFGSVQEETIQKEVM